MPTWARKKDANHAMLVQAFQRLGFSVLETYRSPKCCDLVVAKSGAVWLVEVKEPGETLTPEQQELFRQWQGPTAVVRTVDDVLALLQKLA